MFACQEGHTTVSLHLLSSGARIDDARRVVSKFFAPFFSNAPPSLARMARPHSCLPSTRAMLIALRQWWPEVLIPCCNSRFLIDLLGKDSIFFLFRMAGLLWIWPKLSPWDKLFSQDAESDPFFHFLTTAFFPPSSCPCIDAFAFQVHFDLE